MGSKNKTRKSRRKNQREELELDIFESNDTFAFIAGYTSGGVPYGITWEEMETIEQREKKNLEKRKPIQSVDDIDLPFN